MKQKQNVESQIEFSKLAPESMSVSNAGSQMEMETYPAYVRLWNFQKVVLGLVTTKTNETKLYFVEAAGLCAVMNRITKFIGTTCITLFK